MPIKDATPIKEAIKTAFVKTGKKFLTFGDLKFILLSEEVYPLRRYPTKAKKRLYQSWEKQFKKEDFHCGKQVKYQAHYEWEFPFKRYKKNPSYIAQALKELQKDGVITKTMGKKYRLSIGFLMNAIRDYDKAMIGQYGANGIITTGLNFRFYGFDFFKPYFEQDYSEEFMKIVLQFDNAISEIHKRLIKLEGKIVAETWKKFIEENRTADYSQSDKRLGTIALLYLGEYIENHQVIRFDEIFVLKKGLLVFEPDDRELPSELSEKIIELAEIINSYMFHVLNYGKDKTIVIHPFPGKIDEKRVEDMNIMLEKIKELMLRSDFDTASEKFLEMTTEFTKK